ncbi:PTS system, D-glucosaminate-specific IIA component [Propionispira arboris]|uniref:PTS system, D-glucosaminate-specific IIA component n=1 Tax=Propionispira arboris TaxID=84035 RepID=A0A1H7C677_9FIRM|nr:PTS sugar transporter subunit IIA [Propionispira arboris]SEJ84774.1 PTS system, D-glucosaminate-specific IIA component [Propionispira arboris]
MEKAKILLLTHGGWGKELVESLKMIIGNIDCVEEIPLLPQYTFSEYFNLVKEKLKIFPQNTLIITDLFGGTTTNVAAKLGQELGVQVISGLNAPLLLEACSEIMNNGTYSIEALLKIGNHSCKDVVREVIANINKKKNED